MTSNTLLAVDGNSLVHRSFHALASSNLRGPAGQPTWAVKGFCNQVLGAIERVGADAVIVGFDDHTHSVRKTRWPDYKATRKPKPPELGEQLALTAQLLRDMGVHVLVPPGLEADDVLASASVRASGAGWRTVIVTSDRDSFALISETTSVLRLITGGIDASPILTPERLVTMNGIRPEQYREYAAMRGDTSDNLPGITGIGEKTAAKILSVFGTVEAAFADVDAGGATTAAQVGKACVAKLASQENRDRFWRNVEIMTMRTDLDLGGFDPDAGAGSLPVPHDRVLAALDGLALTSVRVAAGRVLSHVGAQPATLPEPDWGDLIPMPEEPPDELALAGYGDPYAGSVRAAAPHTGSTAVLAGPPAAPPTEPREAAPAGMRQRPTPTPAAMPGSAAVRPTTWDDTLF